MSTTSKVRLPTRLGIIAVGAAAFVLVSLVACTQEGAEERGNLFVPQRTHLSVCVDAAGGGSATAEDVDNVVTAVGRALATLELAPPEFGEPSVSHGCPPPITLTGERLTYVDLCCELVRGVSDTALLSEHRLFIYFVADDMYDSSFGEDTAYSRATAERLCKGDTCAEMTTSVYVRRSAAVDVLVGGVLRGLSLDPKTPEPAFDPIACQQGTPQSGCDRYLACVGAPSDDPECEEFWRETGLDPAR